MDLTKMGMIQLQNPSHPTALLQKANQMRLAGTLCDVVIMVDSQEFHAHRAVLACTSKMFEILFHRNSHHYTLDFLSPKTFQQILEYAYTATLQAKVEDLDDLLYAAEILEIEYLEEQCLKILETIQSSDENDTEANDGGGGEEDDERRTRHGKSALISKKHSMEEGGYNPTAQQGLSLPNMVDQSPSVSTSFGLSTMSPTKAAVDSLMSIGQSLLQGGMPHGASGDPLAPANTNPLVAEVKTEMMQVDENQESPRAMESGSSSNGERSGESDRNREGPGTPTRSSVITSARELHYVRDETMGDPQAEAAQMALEGVTGLTEKHLAALYSVPSNHKNETMVSMPTSVASSLHMSPALAMSMDFSAYGGLLPQSFIQREFFSKLGELSAGVKPEGRNPSERCNVCGAELPDNDAVEQHRKLHSGMKTYGCELCGKRFLDSLRLRMHLLSHSAGAKAIVCDQCGAQFPKEDDLEAHRQVHTGSDMAIFCLLCGKRFQTQTALQQHMEVHAGVRSYICSECNRTFPSHTALKRHLRSHTAGDHPFECEFCGSCFRDESTLKGHKRIHTGEKPYECNGCGKKFSLKHQLETHYRVHTGEKPFECKLCHQRSRDYSAMIKHLRTHNGASPYQCTICLEYCPSLSAMQKHMKGHKPEDIPPDWRIEKTYLYLCYV
ncbi:zinc finger and BTB domain-containing protein 16-A isoform X1 [Brienomyrus brachyistius]|uniref:zinc finger and BTB domain-containing protein 16-A isoform X1 n=1 Tax=Brienomyrus brachyistius TaxID=42636 RepID=UPI0020B1A421|nr:zinc finger and BTB domain-containing protein 16-A isoform X1 [Brienomyrus brachyistius]XP_048838652.1 zinc finger and BTB domain-containing protein 16-A isoform X1 [Brienomyrus brachyistius]XP_048838653.1 zinc finger and BTB domain-containing protein 16-A isoform X1 [Brienomyrus brachyistius]XP_048838654.1 zinc finger and BTB domain-containing protein 16-A isoform X1 [Brienomyrus brachyistius]XP_048838655.1 zinc finger and BTB domain-containing protein 16-A isoform X1 [Brienomyrus brachyist